MLESFPPRLSAKISIDTASGCWIWTAARDPHGYGRFRHGKRTVFAHRLTWELLHGTVPPELDHLCRNPPCCNPAHLEPVTHAVNVQRGEAGPVAHKRNTDPERKCPAGHPMTGANLYVYPVAKDGYPNRQCRACRAARARERYWRNKATKP